MKCYNKVIFSKLIVSVKVLSQCSCELVAFTSADYIKKDYFYDESKHYESISDCNSCHVHNFLLRVLAYYVIGGILGLYNAECLLVSQREKNS